MFKKYQREHARYASRKVRYFVALSNLSFWIIVHSHMFLVSTLKNMEQLAILQLLVLAFADEYSVMYRSIFNFFICKQTWCVYMQSIKYACVSLVDCLHTGMHCTLMLLNMFLSPFVIISQHVNNKLANFLHKWRILAT